MSCCKGVLLGDDAMTSAVLPNVKTLLHNHFAKTTRTDSDAFDASKTCFYCAV